MTAMGGCNPEIGRVLEAGGYETNLLEAGSGAPVLLIHGSGPGVTAWANWRLTIPVLARRFRVLAPEMLGFGYTAKPSGFQCDKERWIDHLEALLDRLKLDRVDLVGNSFGGGLALAFAIHHPQRVRRLVLMGSCGIPFRLTEGLDAVWGYTPSIEAMRELLDLFAFDRTLVTDELAELRYSASVRPGFQEAFAALFPAPRQRWIDALASDEADIRALPHQTLVIHGREDRIIPLEVSLRLSSLIERSQLHVLGQCGHWTQIEHAGRFTALVENFLSETDRREDAG